MRETTAVEHAKEELEVEIHPIGTVRSPVVEPMDENWGDVLAEVHLEPFLAAGLQGIEQFSHAIVVFYMHQATFELATDLVRRPRKRADMPEIGLFATRARHRVNPIGITPVEIVQVDGNVVKVKGLDAIDGTPVLDIKPYFPIFDRVENAVIPEWVERLLKDYF